MGSGSSVDKQDKSHKNQFEKDAKENGLTTNSIKILRKQDCFSNKVLCELNELDIQNLKLTVGQTLLLRKWAHVLGNNLLAYRAATDAGSTTSDEDETKTDEDKPVEAEKEEVTAAGADSDKTDSTKDKDTKDDENNNKEAAESSKTPEPPEKQEKKDDEKKDKEDSDESKDKDDSDKESSPPAPKEKKAPEETTKRDEKHKRKKKTKKGKRPVDIQRREQLESALDLLEHNPMVVLNWEKLLRSLELSDGDVIALQHYNIDDPQKSLVQGVSKWYYSTSKNTLHDLQAAMQDNGFDRAADDLSVLLDEENM